MRKTRHAKNSGTSAAEEPDDEQVWCDICKEEKDEGDVEKIGGEDVCGRCWDENYHAASDEANREMGLPAGEDWGSK